ncbi:MAG: glycoside hydrolase family 3 protein [Bacillota bacterium]
MKRERPYFEENEPVIRDIAAQGMVLLENNNNTLPLNEGEKTIALYGGGAIRTVYGGCGSAIALPRRVVNILDAFKNAGYKVVSEKNLLEYDSEYKKAEEIVKSFMQVPGYPQVLTYEYYRPGDLYVPDEDFDAAASQTGTAIYVISRTIGEGWDRRKEGIPLKTVDEDFKNIATEIFLKRKPVKATDNHKEEQEFMERTDCYVNSSYELTEIEKSNISRMVRKFKKTVLLLNVGGVIDAGFFKEIEGLGAVLLISYGGMECGNSVLDVLEGRVTPSGKLTDTWAYKYEDYPASKYFARNGDGNSLYEEYTEGIYVGYRYFDTFGIKPIYEFGYGKSYTKFDISVINVAADEKEVVLEVAVANTGNKYSGKEVVQVYYSAPDGVLEHPYQELVAFAKTRELKPGERQTLKIRFPVSQMASYCEEKAAFILEAGDYILRVGNSSRNTHVAAVLRLNGLAVAEQLTNQLNTGKLNELTKKGAAGYGYEGEQQEIKAAKVIELDAGRIETLDTAHNGFAYDFDDVVTYIVGDEKTGPLNAADRVYLEDKVTPNRKHRQVIKYVDKKPGAKLADVMNGKLTLEEFVAQMSLEELAFLCNFERFADDVMEKYGIPTPLQFDGPAGIRILKEYTSDGKAKLVANELRRGRIPSEYARSGQPQYLYCSAWPASILIAQSWDLGLCRKFGEGILFELRERGVNVLLAPGLNIHRDPLLGRSFEYFSEDPVISGLMAAFIVRGIQSEPGYGACIKHIALNNQETDRYYSNSVASERTIREIYLKGFCMVIRAARPLMIMTSYNFINGVHASESFDLCTDIIRGEWGFKGLIRTDGLAGENHDLSMYAGNEWISYLKAYREIIRKTDHTKYDPEEDKDCGPLTEEDETIYLGDVQKCAMNILRYIMYTETVERLGVKKIPYIKQDELVDYLLVE